jgi:YidC/Oxa1 family membrane protein insertase
MFGDMMYGIYTGISWILLRWHQLWDWILPERQFLGTNWEWILAIMFLVITVRVILFPIFVKQIRSQRAMQALAPHLKALREKHKGDRESLQRETMELYKKEKVNPLMGCLPLFLQIPVFFGLFHVLSTLKPVPDVEARITDFTWNATTYFDAAVAELFGAPIASSFAKGNTQEKIVAGILVLIMMITTYLTSRQMILKTGWNEDPTQRMIQKLMLYGIPASLLISGIFYPFPIGVVIYWVTQNLFSLAQQQWVLKKYPPPASAVTPAKGVPAKGTKAAPGKATGRPAAKATGSAQNPVQEETKSGLFRRKKETPAEEPAAPAVDGRALAPKPGAKPVNRPGKPANRKKGGSKAKR